MTTTNAASNQQLEPRETIETHLGELPFTLIDEIHERRQTIYRGLDYRLSPDVAAKLKTDLDYLMAFVVALRQLATTLPTPDAVREAAYDIVGLERVDVHRVAEIIQRYCFPVVR